MEAVAPIMGSRYDVYVRVIARKTLEGFVRNRVTRAQQSTVKSHLDSWYAETAKAEWKNSAALKAQYNSASIISAERVVFNIKGNDFRLVVSIHYHYQIVLIKWLGTHREYDALDVLKVDYDKERYENPADSK